MNTETERSRIIFRTSLIGIAANVLLSVFKVAIGLLSNSIAIILDAVNNISDAASSLITIIGTKLAGRQSDREHPFGYGRIEYLSALTISAIILYAGLTSFVESLKKIISPVIPDYSVASLIVIAAAVIVKIVLGTYVKKTGERVNSDSLVNSGEDARLDAIISASTLVAALIFLKTGISLEAFLGLVISVLIIRLAIEMVRSTVSRLLGEPSDVELVLAIKKTVTEFPEVHGAYDLVLHDYGPDRYNGSLHIEVDDDLDADQIDRLTRNITDRVLEKHSVLLTAISVYSLNSHDKEIVRIREKIRKTVLNHEHIRQMHGFYVNRNDRTMRFDIVVSFDEKDRQILCQKVLEEVREMYPDYDIRINVDMDLSEIKK